MNKFFLTIFILLLPCFSFAQTGALDVADERIIYDSETEVDEWTVLYMFEGSLVASTHDVDEDGLINYWISYEDDIAVREIHDMSRDGEPDLFITLDETGQMESLTGLYAISFQKPPELNFETIIRSLEYTPEEKPTGVVNNGEDLVGDLSRIEIPGKGLSLGVYLVLLIIIGIGGLVWWGWRKQKRLHEEVESFEQDAKPGSGHSE